MFPHSKFNDSESSSILRVLREQEQMADKKLTYPLENIEPSLRANALPPLETRATQSFASVKVTASAPPVPKTAALAARRSHRSFSSDDTLRYDGERYDAKRDCAFPDHNGNFRQRRDFDAYLDDAVKRHEEEKLFSKQRNFASSENTRVRHRMERPKSAYYGRRRPQTSLGSYPERIDLSFDD